MEGEKPDSIIRHEAPMGGKYFSFIKTEHAEYILQTKRMCRDFYEDYLNCASRTGFTNSGHVCKEQYEDLRECSTQSKRKLRQQFITAERLRQGRPPLKPMPMYVQKYQDTTANTEYMTDLRV